jgi:hypothetical protein
VINLFWRSRRDEMKALKDRGMSRGLISYIGIVFKNEGREGR